MSVSIPEWFKQPVPVYETSRRDFYVCTNCHSQSCGGIYSLICNKCSGVTTNPSSKTRSGYLCVDCSTEKDACICDINIPPPSPPTVLPTRGKQSGCCCCS